MRKMVNSLFVSQEKFAEFISLSSEASVIIVSEKFVKEENYKPTLILVEDAYLAFQVLMNLYQQMREKKIRNWTTFYHRRQCNNRRRMSI